jgi:hypothetical protein
MIWDLYNRLFMNVNSKGIARVVFRNGFFFVLIAYMIYPLVKRALHVDMNFDSTSFTLFGSRCSFDLLINLIGVSVLSVFGLGMVIVEREKCKKGGDRAGLTAAPLTSDSVVPKTARPFLLRYFHLGLLSLVLVGAFFYYQRGTADSNFSNDEFQVIDTAYGYLQTGQFRKWDFCTNELSSKTYLRAFPHTWLVAIAISKLGMSEWSTRLVSVIFGVLAILAAYFVAEFFLHNRLFSIFVSVTLMLHPDLTMLFQITRMYGMLIPSFLLLFFCLHRLIPALESDGISVLMQPKGLAMLIATVLLIGFNASIHINSLVILLYVFFLILLFSFVTKQKAFRRFIWAATGACVLIVLVSSKWGVLTIFTNHMSLFGSLNSQYAVDLFRFPFGISVGGSSVLLSALIVLLSPDRRMRINMLSLFSLNVISVLFFVFIAKRYYAFKYISFLIPVAVIWIFYSLDIISRLFFSRWKRLVFYGVALSTIVLSLVQMKPLPKGPDFRSVYSTIQDNYEADKKELIVGLFLRCYYLNGIGNKANVYNLEKGSKTTYKEFMNHISRTPSGWVTWETKKKHHIDFAIRTTVSQCFKQYHGSEVDNSGIELFSYDQDLPCIRKRRNLPARLKVLVKDGKETAIDSATSDGTKRKEPSKPKREQVDIDLSSSFTISFWVKSKVLTPGSPISLGGDYSEGIKVESRSDIDKGGYRFRYSARGGCNALSTGKINDGKWHWTAFYQTGGNKGDEIGIYVDGEKIKSCNTESAKKKTIRFLINNFNGKLQDIRIYDAALSKPQMSAIYNDDTMTLTSRLEVNGETFIPKYHLVY